MWNQNRSVILSSAATKVAIVLLIIAAIAMPELISTYVSFIYCLRFGFACPAVIIMS
ncbi:hypothetical protein LPY66_16955 [Dehalobacter sp. DCM]|uniref:hypothetical protein n=1 Tax=Dehalobacter sp. DCM TaxID=2907827 RepID=UPI0030817F78|nr:hypothetical protein LPY66_16955 [Dehalobacter sp. DCM]